MIARVKFAVAAAACLALVGGAASLLGRGNASEPPINAAATAPAFPTTSALKPKQIEDEPNPGPDEEKPLRITAYFERADKDKITVTIGGQGDAALARVTVSVAADAKITQNDKPLRLTDLKPGWLLKIMLSADESKVIAIRVKEGEPRVVNQFVRIRVHCGTLKSLDRDGQITITTRSFLGVVQDRTVPLAKMVKTEIDGVPAAIADLKPGMAVWLTLASDGKSVAEIIAKKSTP